MEGVSHEACSLAGHLKLGELIGFYDDNHITIDGSTDLAFSDNTTRRFEAYGWQVQRIPDGNDLDAIDAAIDQAKRLTERPSLIIVRTHSAWLAACPRDGMRRCRCSARRTRRPHERRPARCSTRSPPNCRS